MRETTIKNGLIVLGQQADNESTVVVFDVKQIEKALPVGGGWTIANKRANDADGYPVASSCISYADGCVRWTLKAADLAVAGNGECQLKYTVSGVVAYSAVYKTAVARSLGASAEPPTGWQTYLDEAEGYADTAEEAAEEATEAAEAVLDLTATATIDANTGTPQVTVTKTTVGDHFNLAFDFKNCKGADGQSGQVVFTAANTFAEVEAAYNAGYTLLFKDGLYYYRLSVREYTPDGSYYMFTCVHDSYRLQYSIADDDVWRASSTMFAPYSYGVAHSGEFLVVGSNGNVTTQAFSTLEGGSY